MQDIKLTETGDIDLGSGDVAWVEPTRQHQRDILIARKGDYKTAPATGVGLADFLNDENPEAMLREIRTQMARDGIKITALKVTGQNIELTGNYE